jgi:phage major head subunit gpT-like protein
MRTEFQLAYEATAEPAPWEGFTTKVPSKARIEHYTWMTPSPGLQQYKGHRRYGKLDATKYSVENVEFDAAFQVKLRDIEDDQTGGYQLKPKELAERAKLFPGRAVIKQLALGTASPCFDGTNFFADSHTIGVGDNNLTFDGAANDGLTYKLAALHTGGPLKPLLWQDRKPPKFEDNSGTQQSKEAKLVNYWIDLEGAAAYGYWWDAVFVAITDTPTVVEFHTILQNILNAFYTFQLPKALTSDDGEFIHEQRVFTESNLTLVGSVGLTEIATQALAQDWVPQTIGANTVAVTNRYKGKAKFIPSALMG